MGSLILAIFLISLGFVAGWRFGYHEVTDDVERIVKRVIGQSNRK